LIVVVDTFLTTLWLFIRSLDANERLAIESHWGGLGGGLGGWRISRPLIFLVVSAVTFALMVSAMTVEPRPDLRERYRAALNFAAIKGMRCDDRGIVARRLVVLCMPPSSVVYNQFWEHVKLTNPSYDDIVVTLPSAAATAAGPGPATVATSPVALPTTAAPTTATASPPASAKPTPPAGSRAVAAPSEQK
jgi:hypothetical protein